MSLIGTLSIARNALNANSAALQVTGQNVANATTVGYARRRAVIDETAGGGVSFQGTARMVDRFAYGGVVEQEGRFSAADARANALQDIESIIAPTSTTIGDRATALMTSFQTLASRPNDPSARAAVLAKAEDFAGAVSSTADALATKSGELFDRAKTTVGEVNQKLAQIAKLNDQIAKAKATGGDDATLRDQRDIAIRDVGSRIGARAVEDSNGKVTLYAAGTALVADNRSTPLSVTLDSSGKMQFSAGTNPGTDVTSRVDTGALGGLREARDVDLAKAQSNLDAYAFDVSNTINGAHAAGVGKDGVGGRDLFTRTTSAAGAARAMSVSAALKDQPDRLAAAGSTSELPGGNTAALSLAKLADKPAFGGASITDRFAAMSADIGSRTSSALSESDLRSQTLATAETFAANVSGVSIDEEMTNLTQFQRAFQASSQVLKTVDSMYDAILSLR